jgi:hypothetical protein
MRGLRAWLRRVLRRGARPEPLPEGQVSPYLCERCGRRTTTVVVAMEDEGFDLCTICRRAWVRSDEPPREGAT